LRFSRDQSRMYRSPDSVLASWFRDGGRIHHGVGLQAHPDTPSTRNRRAASSMWTSTSDVSYS
jgi:hypothetical protein